MKLLMTLILTIGLIGCGDHNDAVSFHAKPVAGNDGSDGESGDRGEQGITGIAGAPGTVGKDGVDGKDGLGCRIAREIGMAWIMCGDTRSVVNDGTNGVNGKDGATGLTGKQGLQGVTGEKGMTGATGAKGMTGATGPQGIAGIDGSDGADGIDGDNTIFTQVFKLPILNSCRSVAPGIWAKNEGDHADIYNNIGCRHSGGTDIAYCNDLTDAEDNGLSNEICEVIFDNEIYQFTIQGQFNVLHLIRRHYTNLPNIILLH